MMERNSFTFYRSFLDMIDEMGDADQLQTLRAIISFALDGEDIELNSAVTRIAFKAVRPLLESNRIKYQNGCKGAEYGAKGGRPKRSGTQTPQTHNNNGTQTPQLPHTSSTQTGYIDKDIDKDKDKDMDKDKDRNNIPPHTPHTGVSPMGVVNEINYSKYVGIKNDYLFYNNSLLPTIKEVVEYGKRNNRNDKQINLAIEYLNKNSWFNNRSNKDNYGTLKDWKRYVKVGVYR